MGSVAWVTSMLFVGETATFPRVQTDNAAVAAEAIRSGTPVLLPPESWDVAAATLRLMGVDETAIAERIHFARTGLDGVDAADDSDLLFEDFRH